MSGERVPRVKLVRLTEEEIKKYEKKEESDLNESLESYLPNNDDNFLESVPGSSSQTYAEAVSNEQNRQKTAREIEEENVRKRLVQSILRATEVPTEYAVEAAPKPLAEQTIVEYERSFGQLTRVVRKPHPMCEWNTEVEQDKEGILNSVYKTPLYQAKRLSRIFPIYDDIYARRAAERQRKEEEEKELKRGNPMCFMLPEKKNLKMKSKKKDTEKDKRRRAVTKAYEREEMIRKMKRAKRHWNQKKHNDGRLKALEKKSKNLQSKTMRNAKSDPEFSIRTHQAYGRSKKILKHKNCSLQAFNSVWGKKRF